MELVTARLPEIPSAARRLQGIIIKVFVSVVEQATLGPAFPHRTTGLSLKEVADTSETSCLMRCNPSYASQDASEDKL